MYSALVATRFAAHQPLPPGYRVVWVPSVEHYVWECDDGRESAIHWDRWACWRGAWADFDKRTKLVKRDDLPKSERKANG